MIGEQMQLPAELHDWRPAYPPPAASRVDAQAEIVRLWAAGYTTAAVCRSLNGRAVPTPSGRGRWHPDSVRRYADPIIRDRWAAYMRRYRAGRR